jgi:hypothetical protein
VIDLFRHRGGTAVLIVALSIAGWVLVIAAVRFVSGWF